MCGSGGGVLKFRLYPFFIMQIKEFAIPNMRHHLGSSAENYVYGQFAFLVFITSIV